MLDYLNESETLPGKLASGLSSVMQMVGLGFLGTPRTEKETRSRGSSLRKSASPGCAAWTRSAAQEPRDHRDPRRDRRFRGSLEEWQSRPSRKRGSPPATLHRALPTTCASSIGLARAVFHQARRSARGAGRGRLLGAGGHGRSRALGGTLFGPAVDETLERAKPDDGKKDPTRSWIQEEVRIMRPGRPAESTRCGRRRKEARADDLDAFNSTAASTACVCVRPESCRLRRVQSTAATTGGGAPSVRPQRARLSFLTYSVSTVDYVGVSKTGPGL